MAKYESIRIDAPDISLEGRLYRPTIDSNAIVVVCHPHPQRGGDMDNNVVLIAVEALTDAGIAALTFNFRGVGRSRGSSDGGEQDDVRAALAHARGPDGIEHVALSGYSFGAGMAAAVSADEEFEALALISIPAAALGRELSNLQRFGGPLLLVSGSEDHASTTPSLQEAALTLGERTQLVVVSGADHFWWGYEGNLYEVLTSFLTTALK